MGFKDQLVTDLREAFFNSSEFAESATYVPLTGEQYSITPIFDNQHISVDPETKIPIIETQPNLTVNTNELLAAVQKGDRVVVRSRTWEIVDTAADGVGTIKLFLNEIL